PRPAADHAQDCGSDDEAERCIGIPIGAHRSVVVTFRSRPPEAPHRNESVTVKVTATKSCFSSAERRSILLGYFLRKTFIPNHAQTNRHHFPRNAHQRSGWFAYFCKRTENRDEDWQGFNNFQS
ncbi:MAG TPA: hypothetical protein VGM92_14525, partial [Candidatus Kapabacteria bacterium]